MENKHDNNECDEAQWRHETLWTCCSGSTVDKRAAIFIVQTIMIFIIMIFCMCMIILAEEHQDITVWVSLLSAIVGNFLPKNSHISKDDKDK